MCKMYTLICKFYPLIYVLMHEITSVGQKSILIALTVYARDLHKVSFD